MRRHSVSGGLAILAAVFVAACSSTAQPSGSGATVSSASPGATGSANETSSTPKVLRMVIGEPTSIDPNIPADGSIFTLTQMFEPPYRIFSDGTEKMLGAESIDIGPDGTSLTFHLNPDYKWSDGQPVTAHDYEFSWKRMLDPTTASGASFTLFTVKNAQDYNSGTITDSADVAIRAIDDLTLQVETNGPAEVFKKIASLSYLAPIPQHVVEAVGDNWTSDATIVTNGPYRLVSWKHDQEIVMERNPFYGGPQPDIDRIEMQIRATDSFSCLDAYEADEVDFINFLCITPQDLARIQADPTLNSEFRPEPVSSTHWFQFDMNNPRWQDKRIRQALSLGIDRQQFVDALSYGTAKPASVWVASDIIGYSPSHALTGGIDRAKQLLADAGYPGGAGFPEFTITVSSEHKTQAELAQQMWRDNLGVTAQINVLERNAFGEWLKERATEPYDMTFVTWGTDYTDPTNWYIDAMRDDYRHNHFAENNAQFTDLATRGASEIDPDKRRSLFEQADAIVEEEAPVIAVYTPIRAMLLKPYVQNMKTTSTLGMYVISEATIAR